VVQQLGQATQPLRCLLTHQHKTRSDQRPFIISGVEATARAARLIRSHEIVSQEGCTTDSRRTMHGWSVCCPMVVATNPVREPHLLVMAVP
jgi:hypothetical protein